jgi:hypothetical protein
MVQWLGCGAFTLVVWVRFPLISLLFVCPCSHLRTGMGDRVVKGDSLKSCWGVAPPRGFESHPIQFLFVFIPVYVCKPGIMVQWLGCGAFTLVVWVRFPLISLFPFSHLRTRDRSSTVERWDYYSPEMEVQFFPIPIFFILSLFTFANRDG